MQEHTTRNMKVDVITLMPEMFDALNWGVTSRAIRNKTIELNTWNPRQYTNNDHQTVDDRPYGGGPGMVMLYHPLEKTLKSIHKHRDVIGPVIYLTPQGTPLKQHHISSLSQLPQITLLCGRYEGIDQRFIDRYVDIEYSLGDYILSGGELPAMSMIDAMARLMPGILGCTESAKNDSFSNGILEGPCFTRPEKIGDKSVPSVLLSGNHGAISAWRKKESLRITWQKRPDLIKRQNLDPNDWAELKKLIAEQSLHNKGNDND